MKFSIEELQIIRQAMVHSLYRLHGNEFDLYDSILQKIVEKLPAKKRYIK